MIFIYLAMCIYMDICGDIYLKIYVHKHIYMGFTSLFGKGAVQGRPQKKGKEEQQWHFGRGSCMGTSLETTKGDEESRLLWQASKCEKLCEKTMRRELAPWNIECNGGNTLLTAVTSKILLWTLLGFASHVLFHWMPQAWSEQCKGWTQKPRPQLAGVGTGYPKP